MRRLLASAIVFFVASVSTLSQPSGWHSTSSPSGGHMYAVHFANRDTGFVTADGARIVRTTDGGSSWTTTYVLVRSDHFKDFSFIDEHHGWTVSDEGCIAKTTNCGESWIVQRTGGGYDTALTSVFFVDSLIGWTVGDAGTIRATVDGGVTWRLVQSPVSANLSKVFFTDRSHGYVGGRNAILTTTDGGTTWSNRFIFHDLAFDITEIYFWDNQSGFIYANTYNTSYVMSTSNGGLTIDTVYKDPNHRNVAASHRGRYKAWSLGMGKVMSTSNGWIDQQSQTIPVSFEIGDIFMVDDSVGYAGAWGQFAKTTTGGMPTTVEANNDDGPRSPILWNNYPNPFNPETRMSFVISQSSLVTLKVYDVLGREVATLVNEVREPGTYTTRWDARNYPSGVYFYRLQASEYSSTKRLVLLK